ncbi:MAG: hypothetical protein ACOCTG_00255 [Bacteroidota bacterium]
MDMADFAVARSIMKAIEYFEAAQEIQDNQAPIGPGGSNMLPSNYEPSKRLKLATVRYAYALSQNISYAIAATGPDDLDLPLDEVSKWADMPADEYWSRITWIIAASAHQNVGITADDNQIEVISRILREAPRIYWG